MDDKIYFMANSQRLAAIQLICLVAALIAHRRFRIRNRLCGPDEMLHRQQVRDELLHDLSLSGKCRKLIRMSENAFMVLCEKLERGGGLRPTQRMSVEEQVARFLFMIGNDLKTGLIAWFFRRSESCTNRHFHKVLNALLSIEDQYIRQPTGDIVPTEIEQKKRFYPFFKNCIGAIDGTHVRVRVPNKDAPRYRGRKGYPTINALVACTFDLKFTYVLSGWEGTASDSRIIKDALSRDDKLIIPDGRFYLVDGGLPLKSSLIAPYRGVRYHLKEYSSHSPENPKELFNLRHASLRNAIERAFGVLKKRFPIIRSTTEPFYSCETQSDVFLACCILHNFLLEVDRVKAIEDKVVRKVLNARPDGHLCSQSDIDDRGEQIRNTIATEMWNQYLLDPDNEIDYAELIMGKSVNEGGSTKRERPDGTFTTQAYTNILNTLNTEFPDKGLKKDHLKNRLKTLKDNFSQCYDIFRGVKLSGFGWNSESTLIEAEDEVWDTLIQEKPEAAKWRKKVIHHYEDLLLLFSKDRATGAAAATAKERTHQQNKEPITETIDEIDQFVETNDIGLENFVTLDEENSPLTTPPSNGNLPTKSKSKKRKQKKLEEEEEFASKLLGTMNNVADAIDRSTKVMESSRPHVYSEGEIYRELELMGLEDDDTENAYLFLVDRPDKVRALFGCPIHKRISMLAKMMRA
ncbi:uncharacterized protein [Rutidosis leptorrhynchoides]|uniref:uncharacterized protein n=1 Tax=Rutidosis leptorrhynchoides TaxID=125765 RepID=UPI003A98E530